MGFAFVASGPFIRSSYNAIEFSKKVMAERVARLDRTERSTARRETLDPPPDGRRVAAEENS